MNVPNFALATALLLASTTLTLHGQDVSQTSPALPGRHTGPGMMGDIVGSGVMGKVTAVAPDHFTIRTETGQTFTIRYSVNTRIMKVSPRSASGQQVDEANTDLPIFIKATEIKLGDSIGAVGEVDANSVGAIGIVRIDRATAKRIREMRANYGKTWLMGRVTALNQAHVTIRGGPDNATHTFIADENTTFFKLHHLITLADIRLGDILRVEGALKNSTFIATSVSTMGTRSEHATAPRVPQQ